VGFLLVYPVLTRINCVQLTGVSEHLG